MRHLFFFTILFGISTLVSAQNIWTVNNQPSFNADFTNLQAAHDSAQAGDILMIHGSSTNYGSLFLRKRLVIIGPGYFLGQNDEPFTQANPQSASVTNITIQSNGDGSWDPSGSLVTGLVIIGTYGTSVNSLTPVTLTLQRCFVNYFDINNYVTITAKENFFNYPLNNGFPSVQLDGINSATLEHNIIRRSGGGENIMTTNTQSSGVINNNIFIGEDEGEGDSYIIEGDQLSFSNNIFLGDSDIEVIGNFGQVLNNLSNGSTFSGIASNLTDVDATDVVIGWDNPEGFSLDERLALTDDSPAIGGASDGANIGAFQDAGGYVLSGIPFVPNIFALEAPDFGTTGSGITVTIKAKANN